MINNFASYLTLENIFLISNWGVIPFWLLLIFSPTSGITKVLLNSVVIPLLLASAYIFVVYKVYQNGNFLDSFQLYLGIESLYTLFSDENFLLIFWLHFLTINLFAGNWIANDAQNFLVSRPLVIISLISTYFTGPLGLVLYWLIRIFYSKKINYYD